MRQCLSNIFKTNRCNRRVNPVCVDKSSEAVFEKGKPKRVVPLTDLLNIFHQYDKNFAGWEIVNE